MQAQAVVCNFRKCGKPLPPYAGTGRPLRYCPGSNHRKLEDQHKRRERDRDKRQAELLNPLNKPRVSREESQDGRASSRRPPQEFIDESARWVAELRAGTITQSEIAKAFDTTQANVSRWLAWIRDDLQVEQERAGWTLSEEAQRARDDFPYFRARYFKVARGPFKGMPYVTTAFHLAWIMAILRVIPKHAGGHAPGSDGGQLEILSPPRHGKTELLIHFCIWLIVRNADIAIIWIGKASARAEEAGQMIRRELERNKLLAEDFLGPGGSFMRSERTGDAWRDDEFSVSTRTLVQKAPTFRAFGKGGTLQSVDADFIVTDDIEDYPTTRTEDQRTRNREWLLTEVESRKEPETAWLYIGSRNHPHDIAAHLEASEDWDTIVEHAHDLDCELPVEDFTAHVACMLWPEKFSYAELQKKYRNSGPDIVEMRYQNSPRTSEMVMFPEDMLRDCLDHSRVLGQLDLPPGYELVGSIDPSPSVHQVVKLWAWSRELNTRYLIDIHIGRGGMDAWQDIVKLWLETYQLRRWVVEDNGAQADYINKREFVQWCSENGVFIVPHTTGANKHDAGIGIASLIPLLRNNHIVLPYGNEVTRGKVDALIREFTRYDPDAPRSFRRRIDRVVCTWFANKWIDTMRASSGSDADGVDESPGFLSPGGLDWVDEDLIGGWLG